MVGSTRSPSMPSLALSVVLLVLTMLTEKFFFVIFGPIDVVLRSDELYFASVGLFSATGTLLRLIISIYNCFYLQFYYIHNPILRIKSFGKEEKIYIQRGENLVSVLFINFSRNFPYLWSQPYLVPIGLVLS